MFLLIVLSSSSHDLIILKVFLHAIRFFFFFFRFCVLASAIQDGMSMLKPLTTLSCSPVHRAIGV